MTGYGFTEELTEQSYMSVELKSYNNRYLEINHNIPYFLSCFESEIDARLKQVLFRGHIDVNIRVKQLASSMDLHVDIEAVSRYSEAFKKIADAVNIAFNPTLADFLGSEGVLVNVAGQDSKQYAEPLFRLLNQALEQLLENRHREGESTCRDLRRLGDSLESGLAVVSKHADELEKRLKENLKSRFDEMLGTKGYDEHRFLQEIAVMLTRYSINEELVRLAAHIKEYRTLLENNNPVGKRLDFLCQEMNREVNTIGSKSTMVEVNHQVVTMKDDVENIREQIRNIE
jgi:uncharacterized protein (TIGR00255 family)